jgi:hypothetical protein
MDLRLTTLKTVSFYLLQNVSTLNKCRKPSCVTEYQVIIAETEDNLQKAAHKLNQLITEYGLTIRTFTVNKCDGL